MSTVAEAVKTALDTPLRIDLGCGKNKQAGFIGVDQFTIEGVDMVGDLRRPRWVFTSVPEEMKARLELEWYEQMVETPGAPMVVQTAGYALLDASVDEAHCSHFLEHLTNLGDKWERVNFFNELYRVLKPGAGARIIIPHWNSPRYYGDPTHKEAFSEWGFMYLNREWRLANAPHADISVNPFGLSCDFDWTYGYSLHPSLATRNPEYQQHALMFWKDAAQDIIATITKRPATTG